MNGATFKARRKLMGLSLDAMGESCRVTRRTVQRWEAGEWSVPSDAEAFVEDLWLLFQTDVAGEVAKFDDWDPEKPIVLGAYGSSRAFQDAGVHSRMSWAEHTACMEAVMLLLTADGHDVALEWRGK